MRALEHPGWALKPVGRPLGIGQAVEALAQCELSVTVDNGIAHIAHSVGCPRVILEYDQPLRHSHRRKRYVRCKGTEEFLDFMRGFWAAQEAPSGRCRWSRRALAWRLRWRGAR
jgi:hypothetical protein